MRTIRIVLWGLVVVVAAAVAGVYVGRAVLVGDKVLTNRSASAAFARSGYEDAGGPFSLIDTDGEEVTLADLEGKPFAIFFGFTHCPDVCPTHLLDASGWLDALGPEADEVRVVFVSVDPERDTPENLGEYVSAFDERILGLTAKDEATLAGVAERYRVRYEKVPLPDGGYTMNHTSDTLLFDADGEYAGYIPYMAPNVRQNETLAEADRTETVEALKALIAS